jgi:hypothetical protein
MFKFRVSAKKANPKTFEVYDSDRESVKFANCVEIPDGYKMEIKTVKFAYNVEIPDEYKKTYPKTFEVCYNNRVWENRS